MGKGLETEPEPDRHILPQTEKLPLAWGHRQKSGSLPGLWGGTKSPCDAGSRGCTGPPQSKETPEPGHGAQELCGASSCFSTFYVLFNIFHRKNVYTENTVTSSRDRYWSPGALHHLSLIPAPIPVFRFNSPRLAPGNSPASLGFRVQLCNFSVFLASFIQLGVQEGGGLDDLYPEQTLAHPSKPHSNVPSSGNSYPPATGQSQVQPCCRPCPPNAQAPTVPPVPGGDWTRSPFPRREGIHWNAGTEPVAEPSPGPGQQEAQHQPPFGCGLWMPLVSQDSKSCHHGGSRRDSGPALGWQQSARGLPKAGSTQVRSQDLVPGETAGAGPGLTLSHPPPSLGTAAPGTHKKQKTLLAASPFDLGKQQHPAGALHLAPTLSGAGEEAGAWGPGQLAALPGCPLSHILVSLAWSLGSSGHPG